MTTTAAQHADADQPLEEDCLPRVALGDPGAMEACIDRYGGLVHSLARRLLHDPQDAEEAVQDAFADLWRNAERFDPSVGSEKTMVMTVARRRIIDRRRSRERRPDVGTLAPAEELCGGPSDDAIELADELGRVRAAMNELRPEHRRALRLSIFEGWSHSRISKELGIPLGTIKTHIRRALMQTRAALEATSHLNRKEVQA